MAIIRNGAKTMGDLIINQGIKLEMDNQGIKFK
jgi:hypothetical protein